ncbi:MAG: D-alanyl-D-alanine carboxypeptidase family protein [Clostridia bacterium]|nr:D-alanyl-D-alanine carboxypeptidase family protein [Clostridia bacterium]
MSTKHARRGSNARVIGAVAILAAALVLVIGVVWVLVGPTAEPTDTTPVSSEPADTTSTAATTTTAAVTGRYVTTDTVNIRSGPGTEYEVLGSLPADTTVEVLGAEGKWYRISRMGDTAYIHSDYLAEASETTASTTARPTQTNGELLQYDTTGRYVQGTVEDWRLLLVNDWNPISADYENGITLVTVGSQKVDSRIIDDLNAMLAAGKAHGIGVQSGYRAYAHQSTLYWRKVNEYKNRGYDDTAAQEAAGKVVKRPGYSEHNSALAVDLGGSGNFTLTESFENTAAYRWLIENCADYGFILRFPKGKEDITGVIYEAWHFRYVGKDAAKYIMENGLCLEEYLAQTAP